MQQQTEMKQSLNECIEQSEAIQNQLSSKPTAINITIGILARQY